MRVLVVGGTGFVGPPVVKRLKEAGHEVFLFHRGRTEREHTFHEALHSREVEHIHGERSELASFTGRFERFAPEVVLDTFPYSEEDAREVVETFRGIAGRVVALSSGDVYRAYGVLGGIEPGPPDPVPLDEGSPLRERLFPYRGKIEGMEDYEKILVERAVMGDPELAGTMLRLPMVYGPRDPQHRLFGYLKRMDDARPAILLEEGFAGWRWSRGYVEDVAEAIALAVTDERASNQLYNAGGADTLTEAEWVREIGRAAGWYGEVVAVSADRLPGSMLVGLNTDQHLTYDTSRLRNELGYREPVGREKGLLQTVAWERANPPEQIDPQQIDYTAEDAVLADLN